MLKKSTVSDTGKTLEFKWRCSHVNHYIERQSLHIERITEHPVNLNALHGDLRGFDIFFRELSES